MTDTKETVYGWAVEYAKSGRSKCQSTKQPIPQGDVRIGKEVDNPFKEGAKMKLWYGVDALFKSFRLGAADKPRVTATADLDGFADLKPADQDTITELVDGENEFRAGLAEVDADAIRLEHPKNGGVFWSVVQNGALTRVRWGAVGEEGSVSEKEHKDEATATKFIEKKMAEKEKGGYAKVDGSGGGGSGGAKRKAGDGDGDEDAGGGGGGEAVTPVKKTAKKTKKKK